MAEGYGSRKFLITGWALFVGATVTVLGMYLKVDPSPGFYVLLSSGIAAYNWSNLRQYQNGSAP